MHNELLTTGEVAALLKVPVATLYAWRTRGEGPAALRIGKHLRWPSSGVDEWLEVKSRGSANAPVLGGRHGSSDGAAMSTRGMRGRSGRRTKQPAPSTTRHSGEDATSVEA